MGKHGNLLESRMATAGFAGERDEGFGELWKGGEKLAAEMDCPVCGGNLVAGGEVDGMGLVFVCEDTDCESQSGADDCPACDGPKVFVRANQSSANGQAGGDMLSFELRCFNPLCSERGGASSQQVKQEG